MPNTESSGQPGAGVQVRVRFPLALKLTLAATALVLLLSVGFVTEGSLATQRHYTQFAESRKQSEIKALRTRGMATARNLADSMFSPLLNGDLDLVADAVKSITRGDNEISEAVVARSDGRVIATTKKEKLGESLPQELLAALSALDSPSQLQTISGGTLPDSIPFGAPIQAANAESKRREGYLYMAMSTAGIARELEGIEHERQNAIRAGIVQTVLLGVAALLVGLLLSALQGVRFSRAIRELALTAAEVGRGNLKVRARPRTRDEIGVLCEHFNEMTGRIETLLVESVAKAAIDKELERANAIQALLLPPPTSFTHGKLSYCGICEPASQMGGDWWQHYPLDDDRILLCVGDVTGHGIPSAMMTATTKACCDTVLFHNPNLELQSFMKALDHAVREAGKGELVMTLFAAVFDHKRMSVEFANAGHNFPLLIRGGTARSLVAKGARLGDGGEFETQTRPIEPGDCIALYTDGLVECENDAGKEYGMRRFRTLLEKSSDKDPLAARDRVIADARNFYGKTPCKDDITLVVCRVS